MRVFLLNIIFSICILILAVPAQDAPIRVTILHVNDVYQFAPVDGGTRGGLARLLTLKDQIKAENPTISVIMMTAYGAVDLAVEALKEGAADFILKPWNNDRLLTRVKSA